MKGISEHGLVWGESCKGVAPFKFVKNHQIIIYRSEALRIAEYVVREYWGKYIMAQYTYSDPLKTIKKQN
jgi:hypothetical protein